MRAVDPQFLIVLPVRNGGVHLRLCVASIFAQTYRDFRLVILENCSTDGSADWVRKITDARVTVDESSQLLSIESNWARIRDLGSNDEYMTIVGHDDLFDPDFLSSMASLIDAYPDASLYHAHFRLIGRRGNRVRACLPVPAVETLRGFLMARMAFRRDSYGTGYVFRVRDYRRVGGIPIYTKLMFADDALWTLLLQHGFMVTDPNPRFSYRLHAASVSYSPDWQSTFASLERYLCLLIERAQSDDEVRSALAASVGSYLQFWFRWGYLTAARDAVQKRAILTYIDTLSAMVEGVVGSREMGSLRSLTNHNLFERFPRTRWFAWRAARYLRVRYLHR